MQQPQSQRGRLVSAFNNDFGNKNQKRTGNGPSSQFTRGGNNKKRPFKKKPFNSYHNQAEKNTDGSPSVKGKGPRPKFFPNKTLINNNNKKKNGFNNKNEIEEIEFSFKNNQPMDMNNEVEINTNSNILNFNPNNISEKEIRDQRFNSNPFGAIYKSKKKEREQLRKDYIRKGLIDDPDKPRRLENAIHFVGECQDMCPEFERYEREYQKNLDKLEIDQENSTDEVFYVDHNKAVKRYQRSDAGKEQPLPCDVRPPPILKKTLNYLIDEIIMKHGIENTHGFVRDRTRSIRQDFSLQNIRDKCAVEAHERIARYHILSLHQLCEKEGFSVQQEREQLFKVLQSLQEFYDEGREKNINYPNEAEFRAYYIISHIFDNEIVKKAELYPKEILFHQYVQLALELQSLTNEGIYSRLFKKIFSPDTPYLMGCLMEIHFNNIRKNALIAMNSAVKYKDNRLPPYPAEKLKNLLGFDTLEGLLDFVRYYGIDIEENDNYYGIYFEKSKKIIEPEVSLTQKRTELLERKRDNKTFKEIINNGVIYDDTDKPQSMFSFIQPNTNFSFNMNNNFITSNTINNNMDSMEDSNMDDVSMENTTVNELNNQNISMENNGSSIKNTPFIFNKDSSINQPKKETPTFTFSSSKNNTPSATPNTTSPTNNKPIFTFNLNKTTNVDNKPIDNNKPGLFSTIQTPNKDISLVKPGNSTGLFDNKLKQSSTIGFSFPNKTSENKDTNKTNISSNIDNKNTSTQKSLFTDSKSSISGTTSSINFNINNKSKDLFTSTLNPIDSNKTQNTQHSNNVITTTQEISSMDKIINDEKIKKEFQKQFMNNEIKRKNLMQNLSLINHNMNVRPKPPLDDAIVKEMKKRKEVEEESKLFYNDLIKRNTENVINKTIQEEILIQSLYKDIISTLTKEILEKEYNEKKKDNTLLNNYYNALELSTNDIIRSVVTEEFSTIIKSEYDSLFEKYRIKNIILKKAQLERQKEFFDERMKYLRLKHLFSKWNHITKLKIKEKRIEEENIRMKKLEFDNTIKLMEIGPGISNQTKKNKDFIFKNGQNVNNLDEVKNNDDIDDYYYLDYDYEEENDKKLMALKKNHININDIATNIIKKQPLSNIDDSLVYLKIMTSLPNDSRKSTLWTNSQFKIGSLENNIINLSNENENYYYSIDDNIQFSQNKLKNEKNLTILIQNIPYSIDDEMEWDDSDGENTVEENDNKNRVKEYYASGALFQLSIYYFQQNSDPEEIANYWDSERKRLELFLHRIRNYSNIPLILLYWKLPNLNSQQYIEDATYYLRLDQFFNVYNTQQNYQFLSMPFSNKDIIINTDTANLDQYTNSMSLSDTSNKIEKLNIGLTWLIENSQLYSLSSQVMKEIIQNNFYAMFLNTILKSIENEIPYGVISIKNSSWFVETVNTIVQSYNYILTAMIEFLYSSQVQFISLKRKEERSSVEYEDSEEYISSSASSSSIEGQHWLVIFETIKDKINQNQLPDMEIDESQKTQNEETLLEHINQYIQSIDIFKSRQKKMIFTEIQKIVRSFIFDSENHKFPYQTIFNLILKQALNNLQETINDYDIYFIKYNITRSTEEIIFFEDLLERYKNSLYELLNQWTNTTLSQIEHIYFNEQNKRARNSIEDTWHEISKKYQRTENTVNNAVPRHVSGKKKGKIAAKEKPKDLKKEQKLLKDLINSVKKEFPFLKKNS